MKIGLYRGMCANLPKEFIESIKSLTEPYKRIKLAEFLIENGTLLNDAKTAQSYEYKGSYFVVAEVDPSRRWTIEDYDSYEYIKYVDVVLLDVATGYCEWKY